MSCFKICKVRGCNEENQNFIYLPPDEICPVQFACRCSACCNYAESTGNHLRIKGYLLIDLFAEFPDRYSLLQKIWLLRPNAILMNSGFSNYRLIHLAGRLFLNYQAAPVLYAIIVIAALLIGLRKYKRLQAY